MMSSKWGLEILVSFVLILRGVQLIYCIDYHKPSPAITSFLFVAMVDCLIYLASDLALIPISKVDRGTITKHQSIVIKILKTYNE